MDQSESLDRGQLMSRVKDRDTGPEIAFRRAIWRQGIRYRICDHRLPGKPDLVFPKHRLVVYIDGDFWHGHQWYVRGLASLDEQFTSSKNKHYWKRKIQRNIERDFRVTAQNIEAGWRVLRFWESDINKDLKGCVKMTVAATNGDCDQPMATALTNRNAAEFFAGIGLVRLALERRGWTTEYANDNDANKQVMYRENFGSTNHSIADIADVGASDVPDCALYTASFPCNDLSLAGSMAGINGARSSTYWQFIRILKDKKSHRPPIVLLENVVGFLTSNQGQDFEAALLALNELGYFVDSFIVNAANFTPQSRPRLFVVAKQERMFGTELPRISSLRPRRLTEFVGLHQNIEWDLATLPEPPERSTSFDEIVEDLPHDDSLWWNEERTEYFMSQLSDRHRALADDMIRGQDFAYGTAFRRVRSGRSMAELRADGVAGCLRTPKGGSGRQILFKAGRGERFVRLLSSRECARLQGVPDTYLINVPHNQALFGFGDAVCVPVIEWIVEKYLTPVASHLLRGTLLGAGSKANGNQH